MGKPALPVEDRTLRGRACARLSGPCVAGSISMCNPLWTSPILLLWWLGLAAVFTGIGLGWRRLFRLAPVSTSGVFLAFWVGWSTVLAWLETWHLWRPINAGALATVVALGTVGWLANRTDARAILAVLRNARPAFAVLWLLVALWAASRALGPLRHFDTSFYHLTTLEWIQAYPVVPGLGNLHGRLAFNSSFTLYAAMLDVGHWSGRSFHVANGLLLFVALSRGAWGAWRLFGGRRTGGRVTGGRRTLALFQVLLAVPVLAAFSGELVPSLSTDLPVLVLGLVTAGELLAFLLHRRLNERERGYRVFVLAVLVAAGVAVKLSLVVPGALSLALALAILARRGGRSELRRVALPAVIATAAILGPWIGRSIYLSGYLVYPVAATAVPVDWRVPRSLVLDETGWIYGLARHTTSHWALVVGNWSWLGTWWRELPPSFLRSLLAAALALASVAMGTLHAGVRARLRSTGWLVLLPSIVSLGFWIVTVPKPRFAGAALTVVAAGLLALALPRDSFRMRGRCVGYDLAVVLAFLALLVLPYLRGADPQADDGPYRAAPRREHVERTTASGLRVHLPRQGIQCSTVPLPCTPYFRPNLGLRVPGELGQGFLLDATLTYGNLEKTIPAGFRMPPEVGVALVSGWLRLAFTEGVRTMARRARMLLYTERPASLRLRFRPRAVLVARVEVERAELAVFLAGKEVWRGELRPGTVVEVPLELARDFNDVVLELSVEEGLGPPGDPLTGRRRLDVAFEEIEVALD